MEILVVLFVLLFSFAFLSLLVAGFSVVRGITLSILWGWFAVPIFGLPPLSVTQAIAVSLVVGFLFHQNQPETKAVDLEKATDADKKAHFKLAAKRLFQPIFQALGVLLFGYVLKTYFM